MNNKRTKKVRIVSVFLLLNFLQSLILPNVAHALTSGPTAPEVNSFEPVDVTDMVNLASGDLTYSIPLLEVPGPEGGYPLALAYHAGIKPLEDASWVGLGWSLNPGAINRTVNGFADDYNGAESTVRDFWEGGETTSYSVGVGFGIANGASVGLNYTASNDTYKGFGGDIGLSASVGLKGTPLSASIGVNSAGVGTFGVGMSAGPVRLGTNFQTTGSFGSSLSLSKENFTALGVSLSSNSLKPNLTVAGFSASQTNNNAGKISTSGSSFNIAIPMGPVNISLGYSYRRYWMQEKDLNYNYGILHAKDYYTHQSDYAGSGNKALDSYLMDDISGVDPFADTDNPAWSLGGSFPSFDSYGVSGQGLSGSIRPYSFENGSLARATASAEREDGTPDWSTYYYPGANRFTKKLDFRFSNDFSNSLLIPNLPDIEWEDCHNCGFFSEDAELAIGDLEGFDNSGINQHLAGSKHVEWYTNNQIISGNVDIYSPPSNEFNRTNDFVDPISGDVYDISDQVGGYLVTNESGMTYHYSIPAYTYDELLYTKTIDESLGERKHSRENPHPYAYTWLLTAVTGPDYVDRNGSGTIDDDDWGYWTTFSYGKWTDQYSWRTPHEGYNKDIDNTTYSYSSGKKEIYYLDAIRTRTHTALFAKDIREDAKSVTDARGGFLKNRKFTGDLVRCEEASGFGRLYTNSLLPQLSMKLDKIVLVKNEALASYADLAGVKSISDELDFELDFALHAECPPAKPIAPFLSQKFFNADGVFDIYDLEALGTNFEAEVLNSIELETDYSLCKETINSFDSNSLYNPEAPIAIYPPNGKLTLKSLAQKGRNGVMIMPPTLFNYDYTNPEEYSNFYATENQATGETSLIVSNSQGKLFPGDIVKYEVVGSSGVNDAYFYGLILDYIQEGIPSEHYIARQLGMFDGYSPKTSATLVKTKNPPFGAEKYDYWGSYKSDFDGSDGEAFSSHKRTPTFISSQNVDAWSLREITTPLGAKIKIEYGSDKVDDVVFEKNIVQKINETKGNGTNSNGKKEYEIYLDEGLFSNDQLVEVGDIVEGQFLLFNPTNQFYVEKYIFSTQEVYDDRIVFALENEGNLSGSANDIIYDQTNAGPQFGVLQIEKDVPRMGGGIRVASLAVADGVNEHKTIYTYKSGVTSYLPTGSNLYDTYSASNYTYGPTIKQYVKALRDYKNIVDKELKEIVVLAREIPAPSVLYQNVSITNQNNGEFSPLSKHFHFQTSTDDLVEIDYSPIANEVSQAFPNAAPIASRKITINNKVSKVGNLLNIATKNNAGQIVHKVNYNYNEDEIVGPHQGIVQEVYNESRYVVKRDNNDNLEKQRLGLINSRIEYPSVILSTTTSTNGITTTSYNREFDFFTGEPTTIETENSYGEKFRAVSIPAYKKYPTMGLMVNDPDNKNMLTQSTASYLYKLDEEGNEAGQLSANITSWSDYWSYRNLVGGEYIDELDFNPRIWRKHQNWVWKTALNDDGTFVNFIDFDWQFWANQNPGWQMVNGTTRYDRYSKPLEVMDISGNYAATKMGYDQTLPIATAANAKYTEMAYSSAEDYDPATGYFGGEIQKGDGVLVTNHSHTGEHSLTLGNQENGFKYAATIGTEIEAGRSYVAKVWVHTNSSTARLKYKIEGTNIQGSASPSNFHRVGEWYLCTLHIDIPQSGVTGKTLEVWCHNLANNTAYFDDFRFHPLDAVMTSYVYDTYSNQVTYILDAENFFTKFEYEEGTGRLVRTFKETLQGVLPVTEHSYNFGRQ